MYEMRIESMISNRFAHTIVKTATTNLDWRTHETTFMMILPKKAFITKFIMVIGGKSYESFVTDKEEAKSLYDKVNRCWFKLALDVTVPKNTSHSLTLVTRSTVT